MQHNPIISEFSLTPPHQITQYLSLSRFKNSPQPSFARSTVNLPYEQIIVNVKKKNEQGSNSKILPSPQQENIRQDIDACLDAIEAAYSKKPLPNGQQNFIQKPSILSQSNIREDAVHRIDSNIVMNYVKAVYKDYPIKNRFAELKPAPKPQQIQEIHQQFRPRERASSLNRPSSKQKQFLNVTQQSKFSKREVSFSSHKKQDLSFSNTIKREHRQTFSTFDSPNQKNKPSVSRPPQTTIKSQLFQKVVQDFRYCVNCEKSVLSINIDFHERYECSNFQNLYKFTFKELASFVQVKVRRIKEELKQKLAILKEKNGQGESKSKLITNKTIGLIEDYLKQQQKVIGQMREQKRTKYNFFRQSQNNLYSQSIQLTHRLHWFQQICFKLRNEQTLTTNTSFNKAEESKPIEVIRNLPIQSNKDRKFELASPVYIHPHLHSRLPKQSVS